MLYAPKIENILPAFSTDPQNSSNVLITIPYQLNLSVGYEDFTHIKYIIKTATTNTEISFETNISEKQQYNVEEQSYIQRLSLPKNKFTQGQYYKIQIAFANGSDDIGYFSNVGVSKYIKKPTIAINHKNIREIVATFTDSVTYEKVYKYKFDLYDSYGNILETSEEQVHNSLNDTNPTTSVDTWEIKTTLNSDIKYVVNAAKKYPKTLFVMAHMDISSDDCEEALQAVRDNENICGDTSWVKLDAVKKAAQMGIDHKMMFGTDNPIDNKDRYMDVYYVDYYTLEEPYMKGVMYDNAKKVFNIL